MTDYLAPKQFSVARDAEAIRLFSILNATFDEAGSYANDRLAGKVRAFKPGESLAKAVTRPAERDGALLGMIDRMDDEDLLSFFSIQQRAMGPEDIAEEFARGELTEKASELALKLHEVDNQLSGEIVRLQDLVEFGDYKPRENHMMVARTWVGDIRLGLYNEEGQLVHIVGGRNAKAAQKEAQAIIEDIAANEGRQWTVGEQVFKRERDLDDLMLAAQQHPGTDFDLGVNAARQRLIEKTPFPGRYRERKGMTGALGTETPTGEKLIWSRKELKDLLSKHVHAHTQYMAELSVKNSSYMDDMLRLRQRQPALASQLDKDIMTLSGHQTEWAKMQNAVVDKLLFPMLGSNSATKLVGAVNGLTHHLTAGMGNMNYAVMQMMSVLQNTMPEVSFVMNASLRDQAKYYSLQSMQGADGLAKGWMHALDPLKLSTQAFKKIAKPDETMRRLTERAMRDGLLDPKVFEDFVGESSSLGQNIKRSFKDDGLLGVVAKASTAIPNSAEKFMRLHSLSVADEVMRGVRGITDEDQIYQFAKEFMNRTQFAYSSVHRAPIITGPMGSFFGMYKHWTMNYIGNLLEYAGQATKGNFAPLLWTMAGTGAVGGVGAMPFYFMADNFSKMATNQSLMLNIYEMFGGTERGSTTASDLVYFGLPSLLGISLQGSTEAPFANPARDASLMFSFIHWDRMRAMGKAMGSAVDHWHATGESPFNDPRTGGLVAKAMAPRSMVRALSSLEPGIVRSMNTGYPLFTDATQAEKFMYAGLGFNLKDFDVAFRANAELWENSEKMKTAIMRSGAALAQAYDAKDFEEASRILMRAQMEGLPVDSVQRSSATRLEKMNSDFINRQFSPEQTQPYRRAGMIR